ncbi:MAG: hypothetical protein HQL88_07420, partial [Magnetococcales bacterium]|nr:hypothetical protein [Magnetococcales bacterium]
MKKSKAQRTKARREQTESRAHALSVEPLPEQSQPQVTDSVGVDRPGRGDLLLRESMGNLVTIQVTPGVVWLQVPEAGLYVLCGAPSEVVKHLSLRGLIQTITRDGVTYETGPNAVLLSDLLVQNGGFANLTEFPILQM